MPEGSVVLVTGASSGFGKITAALLAKKGFRVFGTSRNAGSDRADGFEMVRLDVDSDESVESCVSEVLAKAGRVDVLVNNAGFALTGALEETSIEEAKGQLETNFFGAVRMTAAILPGMRQRKSGQIINVGSLAGTFPVPFEGFYAVAKAALLVYSEALRAEVRQFKIKVSIVEPGFFRTNLSNARKRTARRIEDYGQLEEKVLSRLLKDFQEGEDPTEVAETIARVVETGSPRLRYAVGRQKRYLLLKRVLPSSTMESGSRRHWGAE